MHVIPANNSVHLPGISDDGFASVVKKKKKEEEEEEKKKKKKMKKKPGNLPNLGKPQEQASYTRSQ
jgi:hypothetical protein